MMKANVFSIVRKDWFPGVLIVIALVVFVALAYFRPAPPRTPVAERGAVSVTVTGLRNDKGNLIVCLYKAGPFPDLGNIAFVRELPCTGGEMTILFAGVPFREYAVLAIHDENRNRIPDPGPDPDSEPIEGMGISNVDIVSAGELTYDAAKFKVDQKQMDMDVRITYW